MTSSQDRAVVKKKLKEMKVSLEKARKAQEKIEKQREKLRRKEQEQMQRKSKKTEKMAAATEGAGEQWHTRRSFRLFLPCSPPEDEEETDDRGNVL